MPIPVQGTQSFARSIAVLQIIADTDQTLSRSELVKICGLTRPTLYRIIASLESEGLIEATAGNCYRIGGRLVSLARTALAQNDIRKIIEPYLERLRDATGETVHLAIRSGDELVYIDKIESRAAVRMTSIIGTRIAFHSTAVGKAFLSAMPAEEANDLIHRLDVPALTKFTTTDRNTLKNVVQRTRQDGYVCDNQENEVGIVCFGAAIRQAPDHPVASISVSVPLFRLDDAQQYIAPLMVAVAEISRQIGCTDPT